LRELFASVAVAGWMNEKERASCIYVVVTLAHSTQLNTTQLFLLENDFAFCPTPQPFSPFINLVK
jgi:hypothetical protein